jgi:hypothetical protein
MLEDHYPFDFSHAAYGREPFPTGAPPLWQPSSESKVLLTLLLLEGSLRPPTLASSGRRKKLKNPGESSGPSHYQ